MVGVRRGEINNPRMSHAPIVVLEHEHQIKVLQTSRNAFEMRNLNVRQCQHKRREIIERGETVHGAACVGVRGERYDVVQE